MQINFNENYWENHYRQRDKRHVHLMPNPHLLAQVNGLVPGSVLDAGCGEGIDSIWLAQNGWRVTAIDISKNALDKAKSFAQEMGVNIDWIHSDLTEWMPPENSFDIVISQYVHTTNDQEFYKKLMNAVKPKGMLFIVGHEKSPHSEGSHTIAEYIDAGLWEIKVCEMRNSERIAPNGKMQTFYDSVLCAHKC